jgi:predicted GNAT family acetyltransferase
MAADTESPRITDNTAESRLELQVEGRTAVLEYIRRGEAVVYVHTGVPPELEGRGIGGQLAKFALDDARARGLKVVARCPYVAAYIERHPEYADLLASAN